MVMLSTTMIMTHHHSAIVHTNFVLIGCIGIITIMTDIVMVIVQIVVSYSVTVYVKYYIHMFNKMYNTYIHMHGYTIV